jgi:hypothetical protein
VHQLQPLDTLAIVKAFCNVFEDCTLWDGAGLEWMLVGGNGATQRASLEAFTTQWRDEHVRHELADLGFERPEQLGALFMGDASYLAELTVGVPPVTDNYPLRISSEVVREPGHVPLYAAVMDESERLARFEQSAFIARVWPQELMATTLPYFRYEGLIKEHFTGGVYPASEPNVLWESLDEVLSDSDLETLPLWLLGSDRDVQRNALDAARRGSALGDAALDLELTMGALAQRDYAGALETLERSLRVAGGRASAKTTCLLLYLLAKNGRTHDARALITTLDRANTPEIGSFVDWFEAKLGAQTSAPADSFLR